MKHVAFILSIVGTLFAVSMAQAAVISCNVESYGTIPDGPNNSAGVVDAYYWNDTWRDDGVSDSGLNGHTSVDLQDNSGAATTLDVTFACNGTYMLHYQSDPGTDTDGTHNKRLLQGYLNAGSSTAPTTTSISLNQIPYGEYNLIVYFSSDAAGREGSITDGNSIYYFSTYGPASIEDVGGNAIFARATDTVDDATDPAANYAVFSGLTNSSQTVTCNIPNFGGIAGFQITPGGPFLSIDVSPNGSGFINPVVLAAEVMDGSSTFASADLYLDGNPISIDSSNTVWGVTTIRSVATNLAQNTTHTGKVVVAGSPEGATNEWTFSIAQYWALSNGYYTAASLTNDAVAMTGHSELRLTGETPLSGGNVDLQSLDSWMFLTAVEPSAVIGGLLGRIQVNGAPAVNNSNIKVVQYGQGSVIIPYPSDFKPLEVFEGENFTGDSTNLSPNMAYGAILDGAISSFTLKRGYTATLAENSNGTGMSMNYVAADGDLRIAVLPEGLNNHVNFIRIYPWYWTTKKGSCDIAPDQVNAKWHYNWSLWNVADNPDYEYVAIKQQPYWPGVPDPGYAGYLGVNHQSGFNEPNNPVEDAYKNLTPPGDPVDAAYRHIELLGTGLRVGSPCVTDGGVYSWFAPYMAKIAELGYRMDYITIHYYRASNNTGSGAASALYNYLKAVYDQYHKPIWLTEFNNGANWTGGAPTFEQNKTCIEAMINMMDAAPWVERYNLYSAVEEVRQVYYNTGGYTPMGAMYRDHVSPIAYQQILPGHGMDPSATYLFESNLGDSSGSGNHAVSHNYPDFVAGQNGSTALAFDGIDDHVILPSSLSDGTDFTFAAWIYWNGGGNWQRIFDFGIMDSGNTYMFLTPSNGSSMMFDIRTSSGEQAMTASPLPQNTWTHVAVTLSNNTGRLYVNGSQVASNTSMTINPSDLGAIQLYLGRSMWPTDPYFSGKLDNVVVENEALSPAQIAVLANNVSAPLATPDQVDGGSGTQGVAYNGSLAGTVLGGSIVYSKVYGSSWLTIAADGTLSGTPDYDANGTQYFTVRATDETTGGMGYFTLVIDLPVVFGDGTWISDSDGLWSETTKWSGSFPANGPNYTADFSTLNITADRTVTLDTSRSIGSLKFGDTSGSQNWTVASGGDVLTLDTGSSASPTIAVNQNTATISAPLAGDNGFTKDGAGQLVLNGTNSLSGILYVDGSSTGGSDGSVCLASSAAVGNISEIMIRNSSAGYSTLQLDGSSGAVVIPADLTVYCRNNAVATIQNLSGTNTLSSSISVYAGGTRFNVQSDAGVLTMDGPIKYLDSLTGVRIYVFSGNGDHLVNGPILNADSGATISLSKSGSGTLTLAAKNTYGGNTTVSGGELVVNGSTGAGATTVASGTTLSGGGSVNANLTAQTGSNIRVGDHGFPILPVSIFSLIDDFESYDNSSDTHTTAASGGVWHGVFDGTGNAHIIDEGGGQVLQTIGGTAWRGNETDLLSNWNAGVGIGETATIFFQFKASSTSGSFDVMFGLSADVSNIDENNAWSDFAVMPFLAGAGDGTADFKMTDAGLSNDEIISNVNLDQWYNIWLVVHNDSETYDVYYSQGTNDAVYGGTATNYRNGFTGTALNAFGVMAAGGAGSSVVIDNLYFASGTELGNPLYEEHPLVPTAGTLNVGNTFTLASGATLEFDVSSSNLYDRLVVGGQFNASGTLKVTLDPAQPAPSAGDTFDLFDSIGGTVSFAGLDLPDLAEGLAWDTSGIGTGVLSIIEASSGYADYMQLYGISGALFEDDANSNGVPNGMEYYLGWDPTNPVTTNHVLWFTNNYLSVVNPFNSSASGVTGAVEWTTDLMSSNWYTTGVSYATNSSPDQIEATLGSSTTNQLFLRLKVEK